MPDAVPVWFSDLQQYVLYRNVSVETFGFLKEYTFKYKYPGEVMRAWYLHDTFPTIFVGTRMYCDRCNLEHGTSEVVYTPDYYTEIVFYVMNERAIDAKDNFNVIFGYVYNKKTFEETIKMTARACKDIWPNILLGGAVQKHYHTF